MTVLALMLVGISVFLIGCFVGFLVACAGFRWSMEDKGLLEAWESKRK